MKRILKIVNGVKNVIRNTFSTGELVYGSSKSEPKKLNMGSIRYFQNILPDYSNKPSQVEIDKEDLKTTINEITHSIIENVKPTESNADGGLYVGSIGVAYMLYYLSKSKLFNFEDHQKFLNLTENYLKTNLSYAKSRENIKNEVASFILGNAGIYAIAAVLNQLKGQREEVGKYVNLYLKAAEVCSRKDFLRCGGDELFVGRAGYICGALWLSNELKTEVVPISKLHDLCKAIVQSGSEYSKARNLQVPLMYAYYNTEYLGAAHGLCSILLILMSVPNFLEQNPTDATLIRQSVDFLLSLQTSSGNFPSAMDEISSGNRRRSDSDELVHWCHGAPGVIYTLAKAYLIWKDDKYLTACKKCSDLIWEKGLLKKGPGICHGVAGNGYAFLLMYRLTNDPKYLFRAKQFSEFMKSETFKKEAKTPDCPFSLYEGLSGTVCFLVDLVEPEKAAFPFMDIF